MYIALYDVLYVPLLVGSAWLRRRLAAPRSCRKRPGTVSWGTWWLLFSPRLPSPPRGWSRETPPRMCWRGRTTCLRCDGCDSCVYGCSYIVEIRFPRCMNFACVFCSFCVFVFFWRGNGFSFWGVRFCRCCCCCVVHGSQIKVCANAVLTGWRFVFCVDIGFTAQRCLL